MLITDFHGLKVSLTLQQSLIKSLRMKESELRELRLEENRNFKRMLDLESLNLDIYMRVPTPATGKIHTAPGFRRINSAQNLSTKPSPQWNRVLNALDAAQTWKTNWEEKKFQNAKNILNDAQLTKDQIIDLRSTLFRLKQKKSLTHKEKLLAENLQNRLKNLDRYLIEYKRNSSRADE